MYKSLFISLTTIIVLILSACGSEEPTLISQSTPIPTGATVTNITEENVVTSEIIQQKTFDQCDSASTFKAQVRFSQSSSEGSQEELVLKAAVGGEVSSSGDFAPGVKVKIEGAIEQHFASSKTSSQGHQEGVEIEVPPNTLQEYTIVWQETRREGTIEYEENGETKTVSYSYRTGLELATATGKDLSCTDEVPTLESTKTPKPTNTPKPPTETPTGIQSSPSQITSERGNLILSRGTIFVGIRENDLYPINFRQNNRYQGFEVDLAREIVQRNFGNNVTIEWIPLAGTERLEAIRTDRIDFLVRNTTHTISRENLVAFTDNYFWDGIRLLVRRGGNYTGIKDMNGKTIVVPEYTTMSNTTAETVVHQAAAAAGVDVNIIVDNDAASVFNEGGADAVAMDWTAHGFYSNDYNAHQAIGGLLSSEPLAIAVSLNDTTFRDEINSTLLEIIADGTWESFYNRWFPDPPPWTIDEMLKASPPPG